MSIQNVNVGVLGHVDSGKTSLVRALSTNLSTASLDKDPQSQERGMTLDLGFSSFCLKTSEGSSLLQVTLVDCPGHASLFRTILGGVAIIDAVLLVVDSCKGIQAQTVESLVLASIRTESRMIVALTKTDLLSTDVSEKLALIEKVSRKIRTFLTTNFKFYESASIPIVPVTVKTAQGISGLLKILQSTLQAPKRDPSGPFYLAVDHCFSVPGNGTVLTGTVLSGSVSKEMELEILPIGVKTKVKTLQVFKQNVAKCGQGDRVGVRVNGLNPDLVERALAVSPPGSLPSITQVVIAVTRVSFFKGTSCKSGAKCHVTVGHATTIATATFFSNLQEFNKSGEASSVFSPSNLYEYVPSLDFQDNEQESERKSDKRTIFALLQFEYAVFCPPEVLVVCSRLDLDVKRFPCRLAFYGAVQAVVGSSSDELKVLSSVHHSVVGLTELRIGRVKSRDGYVDKAVVPRSGNNEEVIGRDMFPKNVKWSVYQDLVVLFKQTRRLGTILGPFGKAGKFRIALMPHIRQQFIPVPGEMFVLRVLKLLTLKPPKLKEKSTLTAKIEPKASNQLVNKASTRSFVQDSQLLYPEYFEVSSTSVSKEVTMDSVGLTPDKTSDLAHGNGKVEFNDSARTGKIERLKGKTTVDGRNPFAIVSGLFETEQEAKDAVGFRVRYVTNDGQNVEYGKIEKPFGKAGKVRVDFQECGGTKGQEGNKMELVECGELKLFSQMTN